MGRLASSSSRSGGDAVEAHGIGLILKPGSARKDRHSKVLTSKGPRDRRVRLAAHTAIQFYDVQDRLGYDRPSKAVDWLINKARNSIDALAKLPPYNNPHQENHSSRRPSSSADDGSAFLPQFQIFPSSDLLSRSASSQSQDLRLSLQSLAAEPNPEAFSGFHTVATEWDESQRMVDWNVLGAGDAGFAVASSVLGQSGAYLLSSQREPLQSSNNTSPSIRAFFDPSSILASPMAENHHPYNHFNNNNPSSISDFGFPGDGYSGFQIPTRIQNEDDGILFKPSSDSRH